MFLYYKLHKHVVQASRLDLLQLLQSLEHEELFLAFNLSAKLFLGREESLVFGSKWLHFANVFAKSVYR